MTIVQTTSGHPPVAFLLALAPSAAAEQKVPNGDRITLFGSAFQVFPAGEPFHIFHGWGIRHLPTAGAETDGRFGFDLAVDGVQRREDCAADVFIP